MDAAADLKLIDEVTPNDDPLWGLRRLSCRADTPCNADARRKIDEATAATDPPARARLIGEAAALLGLSAPFLPLATPLRCSVASQRLLGLRSTAPAPHPINHLGSPPNTPRPPHL